MRIFITGASGFVGGAAANGLSLSHDIVAMARSDASAEQVRAVGARAVRCELGAVTADHLEGCDAIIHSAAFVGPWGTYDDFWGTNVIGTSQLLDAARAAGVSRFVHISTEAALFEGQDMHAIDETYPYPASSPFPYSVTKAEAERRVLEANDEAAGFTTIALRPRLIWGPGDQTVLREVASMVEAGRYVWIDRGAAHTSTAHIDNVVRGIELALTAGRGGEAYFLTDGEVLTIRDFMTRYLATQQIDLSSAGSVPRWLARPAAIAVEAIWRAFRIASEPPLTRFVACIMSAECTLSIEKAEADLGYAPVVSVDDGLAAMPKII